MAKKYLSILSQTRIVTNFIFKNPWKSVLSVKSVAKFFNAINRSSNPENNLQIVQRAIHPSNRDAREQT